MTWLWIKKRQVNRHAPTHVALSVSTWGAENPVGTTVAILTATDQDVGDTHTFTLTDSAGGKYAIVGNELRVASALSAGTDTISLYATDQTGLTSPIVTTSCTVSPAPTPAPDQSIHFGAKTRCGHGGHPMQYSGTKYLGITAGNGSGHWTIDSRKHLVPAGTYGAAPPSFASSYTLTVSEYNDAAKTSPTGSSFDVTVTIVANAAHIREMNATTTNTDTARSFQLCTLLAQAAGPSYAMQLGDTIWCRDGYWNAAMLGCRIRPPAGLYAAGTGSRITIRSETVDTSLDSNGNPALKHGFQMGPIIFDGVTSGAASFPIDLRDVWFYTNTSAGINITFLSFAGNARGVSLYNSRVENGPDYVSATTRAAPTAIAMGFPSSTNGTIDGCHFKGCGKNISGSLVTVTNNIFEEPYEDCISLSSGPNYVEGNFAFNPQFVLGTHADPFQNLGSAAVGTDFGTCKRNVMVRSDGVEGTGDWQSAFFFDDTVSPNTFANAVIENNIGCVTGAHGIFCRAFDNPSVRHNTLITRLPQYGTLTLGILNSTIIPGTGGNYTRNIANIIGIGSVGAVTLYNTTVSKSLTTYQGIWPNILATTTPTPIMNGMNNRATTLMRFTPVAGSSAMNADGTYSGALFPAVPGQTTGAWNDGSVYQPSDPVWVAAHPPAT